MSGKYGDAPGEEVELEPGVVVPQEKGELVDVDVQTEPFFIAHEDMETLTYDRQDQETEVKVEVNRTQDFDQDDVLEFLNRMLPLALTELQPTSAYQYLENRSTAGTAEVVANYETTSGFSVAGLSCNCTGSTVAVALVWAKHFGFCKHSSQLHFISILSSTNRHSLPLDSCATSVCYHPHYPAIIAVGHHTGELSVFRNDEKWAHTELGQTHLEPVISVDWVSDRQKVVALVSASLDGLICVWPLKGRNTRTKTLDDVQKVRISEKSEPISAMTVIPGTNHCLVGLESGLIVRLTLPLDSSTLVRERQFHQGHTGPISALAVCPIAPGLFVSVGTDELLCVRNSFLTEPLHAEELLTSSLHDIAWSKHCPSVVAVVGSDRVAILDMFVSSSIPIHVFEIANPTRAVWNDSCPGTLVIGCSDGHVIIYSCDDGSLTPKPGASKLLTQWEAQTRIVLSRERSA
jgi:WD40 repeat protein